MKDARALAIAALLATATLPGPGANRLLASPQSTPAAENRKSGSEWFDRGMDLHEERDWDGAIAAFRKAIEAGHREEVASFNIACAHARKGEKERAFEWLGKAEAAGFDVSDHLGDSDLDSLHSDPRWNELKAKARASRAGKDGEKVRRAITRFDLLMAASPKDGRALYDVGRDLLATAEYDRAARAFVAAAEAGRRAGTALYNAACARALANQKPEALDLLRRAIEAGFDGAGHMKDDDDLDALRSDPRFAQLLRDAAELSLDGFPSLGARLLRSQKVAEAEEAAARFERYLKVHPESGRAWSNLGYVHLAAEKEKEAARAFAKALERGYRRSASMYNLACAHARLGEKDTAFSWLDRAIDAGGVSAGQIERDDDLFKLKRDSRFRKAVAKAKTAAGED